MAMNLLPILAIDKSILPFRKPLSGYGAEVYVRIVEKRRPEPIGRFCTMSTALPKI